MNSGATSVRGRWKARRRRGWGKTPAVGLAFVFLIAMCVAGAIGRMPQWVPIAYIVMSAFTVAEYARDKRRAQAGAWRTSEDSLHLLELLGGWPGALLAQQSFRHKTRKLSYQIVFWLIAAGHVGGWLWLAWQRLAG